MPSIPFIGLIISLPVLSTIHSHVPHVAQEVSPTLTAAIELPEASSMKAEAVFSNGSLRMSANAWISKNGESIAVNASKIAMRRAGFKMSRIVTTLEVRRMPSDNQTYFIHRWIFISQQIEGDMTVLPPRMAEKGLVALRESTQCFRLAELVSGHPENPARKSSGNFRD